MSLPLCLSPIIAVVSNLGEVVAILTALATILSATWAGVRWLTRRNRAKIKSLEDENNDIRLELESLKAAVASADVKKLAAECDQARQEAKQLRADNEQCQAALTQVRSTAGQQEEDLAAFQRRIDKALKKDGQVWIERVRATAPEFKRLDPDERHTPIIAVVNLKGGVGKTTITANLAAALDHLGWSVLLLDLDLQGSLSSQFIPDADLAKYQQEHTLLNDFLEASFEAEHPKLPDYVHPVLSNSGLVPASDNLFYAESNLTIRWQLRVGNRDPRFLLRKELHLKRITNQYDIVLMDCPPVFNVCCVNALASCDYVLAPILVSKQSTIRVPALLKRLKAIKDNLNSDLHVMGIVANRTWRSELTSDEENRLTALADISKDAYGTTVPLFSSFIRNSKEIREAEDEHRPLTPNNDAFQLFLDLAHELTGSLPNFCRPAVTRQPAKEVPS